MPATKPTAKSSPKSATKPAARPASTRAAKPAPAHSRAVQAAILTSVGWMDAIFEIPRLQNFFEWLNHSGAFLRVASVRLPDGRTTRQNFALQRHAILAVLPADAKEAERGPTTIGREVVHDVSCLATFGVLHGRLHANESVQLGDYLLHHAGFIVLRDCSVERTGQPRDQRPIAAVLINAEHVVGVTDEGGTVVKSEVSRRR